MVNRKEKVDSFEELTAYLSIKERRLREVSRKHLEADNELFQGFEPLYEKIKQGDGVPCDKCMVPVTKDNYGEVFESHSSEKKLKVRCRRCSMPYYGFGR